MDVNFWTHNNTDPNYLVSPNEPRAPPQETTYNLPTQHQPQTTPLSSRFTPPRVIVRTQPQYLNQTQPSTFLGGLSVAEQQISPQSPNISVWSSGQLPSPNTISISPQASIPSPSGSEGMIPSYPPSDQGMPATQGARSTTSETILPYVPPEYKDPSPTRSVSDVTFDTSPEPESRPRRTTSGRGSGRPGGRALGTHLEPKVAKAAHDMRRIVACWHCVLQRDKVRIRRPRCLPEMFG